MADTREVFVDLSKENSTPLTPSAPDAAPLPIDQNSSASTNKNVHFDISCTITAFTECLKTDGLDMDSYLRGYTEMSKLFEVLGTVFSFITSDVYSKLNILRCYRKGGSGDYYFTVQSMLQFEKEQPCPHPSGSRTLLRLHRALAFASGFIKALSEVAMENSLGPVAQPVYARTLAPHHGWILSKTVSAVLLLLPTKKVFLDRLFGDEEDKRKCLHEKAPVLYNLLDRVYEATQELYADYDSLNLP